MASSAGGAEADPFITVRKSEWDAMQRRIEELEAKIAELRRVHREEIARLLARIEELEEKLRTSSRNSSMPPSSDLPSVKKPPRPQSKRGQRKQGAQKGHKGKGRTLLPVEQVDSVVDCRPTGTCDCGGHIVPKGEPLARKQVFEIPKVQPTVTEYRVYEGICEACGKRHRGLLPQGVPDGMLGPRAMALAAVFSGKYKMSKRGIEEVLLDMFGLDVCLGTVSNNEGRVSEALREPVEQAREFIREQSVVNMDETGHKMSGKKAWLWVAATACVSVFTIRFSRGAAVAKEMLGELFQGLLVSDRWSAYNWVNVLQRQLCWAHLIRDFTKISERAGHAGTIGDALLDCADKMFELWYRVRDGTMNRADFQAAMLPIRRSVEALLQQGVDCGHAKTSRTCKNLLKLKVALWTFVDFEGVEPTNNFGERTIRPGVMWRRVSFGTQSARGNLFVERMLTVSATCRQQNRNVLDYVTSAVEAHLRGTAAPSLLPNTAAAPLALAA